MAKQLQYQIRPFVPVQPVTDPPNLLAWMVPWEPPRFRVAQPKVEIQTTQLFAPSPDTLPPQIAGIAWFKPWEPPRFHGVPSHFQQSEMVQLIPSTLPQQVGGMAWQYSWGQPQQRKVDVVRQQTEFRQFIPATLPPVTISTALSKMWEPPYFPRFTKPSIQQTQLFVPSPATLPIVISGIAWWRAWDQPKQKRVDPFEIQTNFHTFTTSLAATTPKELGFWFPWNQPKQVRVAWHYHPPTAWDPQKIFVGSAKGYIIS